MITLYYMINYKYSVIHNGLRKDELYEKNIKNDNSITNGFKPYGL